MPKTSFFFIYGNLIYHNLRNGHPTRFTLICTCLQWSIFIVNRYLDKCLKENHLPHTLNLTQEFFIPDHRHRLCSIVPYLKKKRRYNIHEN